MYATDDINLLASKLIVNGITTSEFKPNDKITRAQFTALLVRTLGLTVDSQVAQILSTFIDNGNVSSWAVTDTAKVTEAGIMQGNAGSFLPKAYADRAQAVVTLKRLLVFLQFIN